ncbi:BrnA antitoxin family protein [Patescibacteria group bacterium]|nr:BrnA antitoxin family protein [Patescibacteria group bacterium]MCG2702204.1 BrnA antitoxin family protein [Candidatus Parcubacteria bacterium]MBU4264782.1 BrnA antitoxin family protein [Patescibacteria group bacterium]MBU4390120.1 BrnA antitoxin family protein [Patescibacteria group bacterium]MBU4396703.1 BrnA antitoxin family protein [Patescibacteria group bacterium]
MKKLKKIPKFKNEDKEREFWATHDATDFFDMDKPIQIDLSELKPSAKSVTTYFETGYKPVFTNSDF